MLTTVSHLCLSKNIIKERRFAMMSQCIQTYLIPGERFRTYRPGNSFSRWKSERQTSFKVAIGQRMLLGYFGLANDRFGQVHQRVSQRGIDFLTGLGLLLTGCLEEIGPVEHTLVRDRKRSSVVRENIT